MDEITRENYREYDAINYSKLSALTDHPSKVNEEKDFSDGIRNGDVLDLFVYEGEDAVHDKYHISTLTSLPSDIMQQIVDEAPNYEDATLIQTARNLDYGGSNWKDSTILRKIEEQAGEYMMDRENAGDKPIISWETFTQMQQADKMLKNHPFTKRFFTEDWEFQKPITQQIHIDDGDPVKFKGLLDGITVNEEDKKIVIQDLKYMSSPLRYFPSDFMKWRYYLQASLYHDLAMHHNSSSEALDIWNVTFYNVVYSSYDEKVQAFKVDHSMIVGGRKGFTKASGVPVKGYKELASELLWHQDTDSWDYPYEVYKNGGYSVIQLYES